MTDEAPALLAPSVLTVIRGAETLAGTVIARAPHSVAVSWENPDGSTEYSWFVWEPGRAGHCKQHGVQADSAMWVRAA